MPVQDQFAALEQAFSSRMITRPEPAGDFEPIQLFKMAFSHRWVIVLCLLLGVSCGLLYTKAQRPLYQSTSKVEIITSSAKVLRELEVSSQANDIVVFETARQKILSRDIAEQVVENLNLAYDPLFLTDVPKISLSHIFNDPLAGASKRDISTIDVKKRHENAVAIVRKNLSAKLLRNTSIVAITFKHPSPAYARAVANATASAYVAQTVNKKIEVSNQARQILEQQAGLAKAKLEASEKALVDYADEQGLTVVGDNSDLLAGNINEINKLLAHAVNERMLAERYSLQLKQNGAASLPQSFESNTVQAAKDKLIDLKAEYQQKLATLKPGFPSMRKLSSQIDNVERSLASEIKAIGAGITIQLAQARQKEESLRGELRKLEDQKRGYQRKNIRYIILSREADSNRAHYQNLIKKLSEVGVGASLKTATAAVVDAAEFPLKPATPKLLLNLLGSLMMFSLLGAFLVYAKELFNDGFSDPEQLADELAIPNMGTIPYVRKPKQAGGEFENSYCILRTAVEHVRDQDRIRTLLVTSTEGDEGKSVTARRLAEDFAQLGERVLLVDADLRQPSLHAFYRLDNVTGLGNMLSNTVEGEELLDCFKATHVPNLALLPAGQVSTNPSYLLTHKSMRNLFTVFTKKYDTIIIDSSPVTDYADASLLSRETDATLFVVASKRASRAAVSSALSRLYMTGGNVIGTAFTMFRTGWLNNGSEHGRSSQLRAARQDMNRGRNTPFTDYPQRHSQPAIDSDRDNRLQDHKVA